MKNKINNIYIWIACIWVLFSTQASYAQQDDGVIGQYQQRLQQTISKSDRLTTLQKISIELAPISPAEAIEYAIEALKIAQEQSNTAAQMQAYLQLGIAHYYGESWTKATQYLEKIAQMREVPTIVQIQAWQYLAMCAGHENNKKTLQLYFDKAYREAEKIGDKNLLAQNALFKAESENSAQALPHYQNALALYEANKNEIGYAKTAQALGDFYAGQLSNPITALYYYQKALNIGDRIAEKRLLTDNLNAIANVYQYQQGDVRTALRYYFQSFVIAQEYDFIQNGSKLAQALKGIHTCYQQLARQRRNVGEMEKAREYDKLAERYQKMWQGILQADYDVQVFNHNIEPRTYTAPNNPTERPRRTTPAQTLRKSLHSPLDTHSLLSESKRKVDSLLIAQKNSQIDHWQEQDSRRETQLTNLHDEKQQQEAELRKYKLWWFWGLLGLITLLGSLLGYTLFHFNLQKKLILKQKNKVNEAQEKANRYVIAVREKEDVSMQKEAEIAQAFASLDEKRMESNTLRRALQEDVLRTLKSTASTTQDKAQYALATLLQENIGKAENMQVQPILPIINQAHAQVAHILQHQQIKFESHITEATVCNCDAVLLQQVFVHLFYNAIKYVPQEGQIRLDANQDEKHLTIVYKDNGQGIPANLHTQALRKSASNEARPFANGLYWAKELLEAQKASIALQPNAMGLTIHLKFTV